MFSPPTLCITIVTPRHITHMHKHSVGRGHLLSEVMCVCLSALFFFLSCPLTFHELIFNYLSLSNLLRQNSCVSDQIKLVDHLWQRQRCLGEQGGWFWKQRRHNNRRSYGSHLYCVLNLWLILCKHRKSKAFNHSQGQIIPWKTSVTLFWADKGCDHVWNRCTAQTGCFFSTVM